MSLFQDQDRRAASRAGGVAGSYLRVTGPVLRGPAGVLIALAFFAAALVPGLALSWYRTGTEAAVILMILAAGYALEWVVAARTGRRVLR